ncbi:hypothetical protein FA13DRAFT_1729917 [Coprinellus micaceus]|uniref:Uncharacterized protein n=1 Tax=Coprinellus micaceus TaxID=71717 RepID=A0A4Y7TKB8_COPMI|nr:hypothetical protein FA13DRAFT_1729917 [Coprinellus micaceus]
MCDVPEAQRFEGVSDIFTAAATAPVFPTCLVIEASVWNGRCRGPEINASSRWAHGHATWANFSPLQPVLRFYVLEMGAGLRLRLSS